MKDSGFGSFLAGVVIGGLIGAALGLLLAPQTGDELREHVGEFVDGKRAEWDEAVNEGRPPPSRRAPAWSASSTPPRARPCKPPPQTPEQAATRAGGRRLSVVNGR